jgi:hypothetical protein
MTGDEMTDTKALAVQAKSPIVGRMSMDQLRARLANTRDETGTNINQFLTYSGKKGEFFYKVDNEKKVVPLGTEVALNVLDAKKGYTCWKEGKPIDDVERSVFEALPPKDSLTDHGPYAVPKEGQARDGWNEFYALPLKDVATGTQYLLKVSSESARRAVGKLIDEILAATDGTGLSFDKDVPVLKLGSVEFKAKGFDNEKPTFEIVKWLKGAITTAVIEDGGASAEAATKEVTAEKKGGMLSSLLPNSKK